jgi:hypothetical protein
VILFPRFEMSNNISKPLTFGEHGVCITNTSIHSFGELVDRLRLSLLPFYLTILSLIIYIRKYLNGLPFWHSALQQTAQHTSMNIVQFKMKLVEDLVGRSIDNLVFKSRGAAGEQHTPVHMVVRLQCAYYALMSQMH